MRKIIVMEFITLDGVIQAPGGPEEDPSENFDYGGWVAPYNDEVADKAMEQILQPADLILGRKTFDIWENYWPQHADIWPGINEVTKYVWSNTRHESNWNNCVFINSVEDIKKLKDTEGGDLKIWGSSKVVQGLLQHNLVDELFLMVHPVILGKGKKLFADGSLPATFKLQQSTVTTKGVIIAHYTLAGEVKTGTVGP